MQDRKENGYYKITPGTVDLNFSDAAVTHNYFSSEWWNWVGFGGF